MTVVTAATAATVGKYTEEAPTQEEVDTALEALLAVREVEQNKMLRRRVYFTEGVEEPKLAGRAICGGHQACFIGSLWLGAGVQPTVQQERDYDNYDEEHDEYGTKSVIRLPHVNGFDRRIAFEETPGLKLAYDLANLSAREYLAGHPEVEPFDPTYQIGSIAESVFESNTFAASHSDAASVTPELTAAIEEVVDGALVRVRAVARHHGLKPRRSWSPRPLRRQRRRRPRTFGQQLRSLVTAA